MLLFGTTNTSSVRFAGEVVSLFVRNGQSTALDTTWRNIVAWSAFLTRDVALMDYLRVGDTSNEPQQVKLPLISFCRMMSQLASCLSLCPEQRTTTHD